MMGASGNKSTSTTTGDSISASVNQLASDSWTNNFGRSISNALSRSDSVGRTFVDQAQAPYLKTIREAGLAYGTPRTARENVGRVAGENDQALLGALATSAGLQNADAQVAAQERSLQSGLGNLFRTQVNPSIRSNAVAAGGFGGGRQGVAEGVATEQLGQVYAQQLGNIRTAANNQAMQAAGMVPGLTQSRLLGANAGQQASMDILSQLASIIGGPTVLSDTRSQSRSTQTGRSVQQNRSISRSRGSGRSESASSSRGFTESGGFGFRLF